MFRLGRRAPPEKPEFRANLRLELAEVIEWCLPRADPANPRDCLRSEALRPYPFGRDRHSTLLGVTLERHQLLPRDPKRRLPERLGEGRLLVWLRDLTIDDGLGEHLTGGYLDQSDMPPWDTWFVYVDEREDPKLGAGYLVSWVPRVFLPSLDEAIRCNAYDALFWLEGSDLRFERIARDEGLLG